MTHEKQIRQVLAELEMLSYGATQNYAASTGGDSDAVPSVSRLGEITHLRYRRRLRQEGPSEELLKDARDALDAERKGQRPDKVVEETREQRDKRMISEGEGFSVKEVAVAFRCSEREVIRARLGAGRDVEAGKAPVDRSWEETCREIDRLASEQKLSGRRIAMILGVDKNRVSRYLADRGKKAA